MPVEKNCGCKGIRTCLLCEKENDISSDSHKTEEVRLICIKPN